MLTEYSLEGNSIAFEHLVPTSPAKNLQEMKAGSVVFIFGNGMRPLACDIDYLYAKRSQHPVYPVKNADIGLMNVHDVNDTPLFSPNCDDTREYSEELGRYTFINPLSTKKGRYEAYYRFLDVIHELSFKYGLVKEYYKNKYGKWIDVSKIRPYFSLSNQSANIFAHMINGSVIDDDIKELSLYSKLCDNGEHFSGNVSENIAKSVLLKDINDIPSVEYIVKENNISVRDDVTNEITTQVNTSGFRYNIPKGDGTYEYKKVKHYVFTNLEDVPANNVDDETIKFNYKLYNYANGRASINSYGENNHHLTDDLLLTFYNPDGTPFTDLNNLFITVNGLVVDYVPMNDSSNSICIIDAVRFATYQPKTILSQNNSFFENFVTIETLPNGTKIANVDVPIEAYGVNYSFDIQVHKWEGVKISHIITPNSIKKLVKTKSTELSKSLLLDVGLTFGKAVNKDKTILLCGNTIVEKDSWSVTPTGDIQLHNVSTEFDILYSRMYKRMQEYQNSMYGHTSEQANSAPVRDEFVRDEIAAAEANAAQNGTTITMAEYEAAIQEGYRKYDAAVELWRAQTGGDKFHFSKSPFDIVARQFVDRHYGIITFDTIESDLDYEIEVIENKQELIFNKPYRNTFENVNWTVDDLIIINGMTHKFINIYENVFTSPLTWYRLNNDGIYDDVYGYKLEVVKHYENNDRFRKVSKFEMIHGVISNKTYYKKISDNEYLQINNLNEFESKYVPLTNEEIALGMDPKEVYYIFENDEFLRIPINQTFFDVDTTYYKKVFTKSYYVLK